MLKKTNHCPLHHPTYTPSCDDNDPTYPGSCPREQVIFTDRQNFPATKPDVFSSRGTKYKMVLHNYDYNAILVASLKSKSAIHQLRATHALHGYINNWGLNPKMHVMDNECPDTVKKYLRDKKIAHQLVLPRIHCTYAAEIPLARSKINFYPDCTVSIPIFPCICGAASFRSPPQLSIFCIHRGST